MEDVEVGTWASIHFPQPRRHELHRVTVGVAQVEALATLGPAHAALDRDAAQLEPWARHLEACGVGIESRVRWPKGGESLYLRDPDGHSVELVTPGLWEVY